MKTLLPTFAVVLVLGCGGNETPMTVPEPLAIDTLRQGKAEGSWTGYYQGTGPTANHPGIETRLWVRSDSTFVLSQRAVDKDSVALGTIGAWLIADGQLELYDHKHVVRRYSRTAAGLEQRGADGFPIDQDHGHALARSVADPADGIPRMQLAGSFTYFADAMSFRPCGSAIGWPCAGGAEWTDEGEGMGSMDTAELQRQYLEKVIQGGDPWTIAVECSLYMGPAMEGDGAEEYLFIHRVLGAVQCP